MFSDLELISFLENFPDIATLLTDTPIAIRMQQRRLTSRRHDRRAAMGRGVRMECVLQIWRKHKHIYVS